MMNRPNDDTMEIAFRIQRARRKAGYKNISSVTRADRTVKKSTLYAHESGERRPREKVLAAYSRLFGVSLRWLKTGEDDDTVANLAIADGVVLSLSWNDTPADTPPLYGVHLADVPASAQLAARIDAQFDWIHQPGGYLLCRRIYDRVRPETLKPGTLVVSKEMHIEPQHNLHRHTLWIVEQGALKPLYHGHECNRGDTTIIAIVEALFAAL